MDPHIARLKTVEDCSNFEVNALARGESALALAARRRAVQLRAEALGAASDLERECLEAVYAYEEVLSAERGRRQPASRTWQMIKRHGIVAAVERIVTNRADSSGFNALARMHLLDLAFEAVVLRHPENFSEAAVRLSRERLDASGVSAPPNVS
ncbi:hypothetical protein EZ242_05760 [Ramlibacter rhizophilus]|uniref:Uncharacterized protein n=2 Tax=Ramlibacter rhizophilus TaxID=1781167 RepID=A0A4Z0BVP7_9BURK|nr:hypothetical protein EZ242_05760 [Ramlibacter rhizophilus]